MITNKSTNLSYWHQTRTKTWSRQIAKQWIHDYLLLKTFKSWWSVWRSSINLVSVSVVWSLSPPNLYNTFSISFSTFRIDSMAIGNRQTIIQTMKKVDFTKPKSGAADADRIFTQRKGLDSVLDPFGSSVRLPQRVLLPFSNSFAGHLFLDQFWLSSPQIIQTNQLWVGNKHLQSFLNWSLADRSLSS